MMIIRWLAGWALLVYSFAAQADGQTFKVPTRPGVETSIYWEAQEGAKATVFLFTGGNGGYGKVVDGKPTSRNFLARSVALFLANGFNVAIFGLPSDTPALDYGDRVNEKHLADARAALDFVRAKSPAPIWLVGTSRGTISATYVAIGSTGDAGIAGLVLTSSVTAYKKTGRGTVAESGRAQAPRAGGAPCQRRLPDLPALRFGLDHEGFEKHARQKIGDGQRRC